MAKRSAGDVTHKAGKSEIVTIRLEPKLRYLAEIAARKHRRSLSSYVEWAIDQSLHSIVLVDREPDDPSSRPISIADEASRLWDVDEPDRFVRLALRYPDLLTHEEQVIWKLVREHGTLWKGHYSKESGEWTWEVSGEFIVSDRLRKYWELFRAVAQGKADKSALPPWSKFKSKEEKSKESKSDSGASSNSFDPDDEIPF